jgi:TPP-dependent pyruvate/acetoin dehydrogenase alpha subunit
MTEGRRLEPALARTLYAGLYRIRRLEEEIAGRYPEQEMRCPTHLSIGQEAPAVGVCAALRRDDQVFSTHRAHAHYIAKGGHMGRLVAELYGKATGCCGGKGGSMHLVDHTAGMMGTSAIVGSSTPLALGAALTFQMSGTDQVAVSFMGDAVPETGVFSESLNFAALRSLPVIFSIENNLYATSSPLRSRQARPELWRHGEPYGIPGVRVDGMGVVAVYEAARAAVDRARSGGGPTIIESTTYRYLEHVGPNEDWDIGYRSRAELEAWRERDSVARFREALVSDGVATAEAITSMESAVEAEVAEALRFSDDSPMPEPSEARMHLYA